MLSLVAILMLCVSPESASRAPVQATFDAEGGTPREPAGAELEMRCDPELKGTVRCHFLLARLEETAGACVFRTFRFDYDFEARGPNRWVHTETTACETALTVELTSQSTGTPAWTYAQTRTGTMVDSEFCRAMATNRSWKFVAGGGKKRSVKCTSVAMALG